MTPSNWFLLYSHLWGSGCRHQPFATAPLSVAVSETENHIHDIQPRSNRHDIVGTVQSHVKNMHFKMFANLRTCLSYLKEINENALTKHKNWIFRLSFCFVPSMFFISMSMFSIAASEFFLYLRSFITSYCSRYANRSYLLFFITHHHNVVYFFSSLPVVFLVYYYYPHLNACESSDINNLNYANLEIWINLFAQLDHAGWGKQLNSLALCFHFPIISLIPCTANEKMLQIQPQNSVSSLIFYCFCWRAVALTCLCHYQYSTSCKVRGTLWKFAQFLKQIIKVESKHDTKMHLFYPEVQTILFCKCLLRYVWSSWFKILFLDASI